MTWISEIKSHYWLTFVQLKFESKYKKINLRKCIWKHILLFVSIQRIQLFRGLIFTTGPRQHQNWRIIAAASDKTSFSIWIHADNFRSCMKHVLLWTNFPKLVTCIEIFGDWIWIERSLQWTVRGLDIQWYHQRYIRRKLRYFLPVYSLHIYLGHQQRQCRSFLKRQTCCFSINQWLWFVHKSPNSVVTYKLHVLTRMNVCNLTHTKTTHGESIGTSASQHMIYFTRSVRSGMTSQ